MAGKGSVKDSFTFVGGLNTEGGFFVTPDNSWVEGVNIVPTTDGSLHRRNGIDYEEFYELYNANITADQKALWAFGVGTWSTVAGDGNLDFFVVQTGFTIHFYEGISGAISATKKTYTLDLRTFKAFGNTDVDGTAVASYASTYGKLIITAKDVDPILVTYDPDTDSFTASKITIEIRDFSGFESPVDIDVEKTEAEWTSLGFLTQAKYNLYNQGWTDTLLNTYKTANSSKLPSNAKQWVYGKDSNDDFSATALNKNDFGSSPAPKGRFVLEAFKQDRSGIITSTPYRPTVCSFFAGRVWYGGVSFDRELGTVYFSQVLTTIDKVGRCHQVNDPTSEVISDLVDSDGGVIKIPEAGEIVALHPLGRGIVVIATNGVWNISGLDSGFSASNYSVERVTSVGCNASKSVVAVEDAVIYWSSNGIYVLRLGASGIDVTASNASDQNIKTFYTNIPVVNKLYAEGAYSATDKVVYWLYSNTPITDNSGGKYNKNAVLALDVRLNSWYWFQFDDSLGVVPISLETTKETNNAELIYDVLAGTNTVINSNNDTIQATLDVINGTRKLFKFLILHPVTSNNYSITFADLENQRTASTKFKDWYTYNTAGIEQSAYILTGYQLADVGPARAKTGMYLTTFMKRTETAFDASGIPLNESGCYMQSRWDFTDNSYANKWSSQQQIYRQPRVFLASAGSAFDDGYPLVFAKSKILGRGKSVQFKFTSEESKDMQLVGWSGTFVGNTNV